MTISTTVATDGGPQDYWVMEHSDCGGSSWVRIRARGLHWINITPDEALKIADKIIARYRAGDGDA